MTVLSSLTQSTILFREAHRASRQWQTYASRTLFSGILLGVLLTAIGIVIAQPDFLDPAEMAKYGRAVFSIFAIVQVILAIGLTPLMVATAVIQERDSNLFPLIGLTNISPSAYFSGIILARLLQVYMVVLGALPVLALVVQLGGVSVVEVVVVVVHTLVACTVLGAIGGVFALFTRSPTFAVLPTATMAGVLFLLTPTVYVIASANPWSGSHLSPFMASQAKDWWSLLPIIAYLPTLHLTHQIGSGLYANRIRGLDIRSAYKSEIWRPKRILAAFLIFVLMTPVLFFASSYRFATRLAAKSASTPFQNPILDFSLNAAAWTLLFVSTMLIIYIISWLGLRFLVDITDGFDRILFGIRRRRRNPNRLKVWKNPVFWRESRPAEILRIGLPLWATLTMLFAMTSQFTIFIPGSLLVLGAMLALFACGLAVWWTGETVRRDQRSGMMSLLLTTTMPNRKIVGAKIASGLSITFPVMLGSGILFVVGLIQFEFTLELYSRGNKTTGLALWYPFCMWLWCLSFWLLSATSGCYTAVRNPNPRISFLFAVGPLLILLAVPATIGNLAPEVFILSDLMRFTAPGVVQGSTPWHFGVATVFTGLLALLLSTRAVRLLGNAIGLLLLLSLLGGHAYAQAPEIKVAAQIVGNGLVEQDEWSEVYVQVANPGPDTNATIEISERNPLGLRGTRKVALAKGSKKMVKLPFHSQGSQEVRVVVTTEDGRLSQQVIPIDRLTPNDVAIGVLGDDPIGITAIFETWGHGVPGPNLRKPTDSFRRVRTALLNEQTLPENPLFLRSFDWIVWPNARPDSLNAAQLDALKVWVAGGGHLFISFTESWRSVKESDLDSILPVEVNGLEQNAEWRQVMKQLQVDGTNDANAPTVSATPRPRSISLATTAQGPLWSLSPFGHGTVSVFLADLNLAPFGRGIERAKLWRELLMLPPAQASPRNWNDERPEHQRANALLNASETSDESSTLIFDEEHREQLANIDGISPWTLEWLMLFAGGYLLLIGPIDYLLLKRANKQHLTWITFPLMIVVFSTAALLSASLSKGSQATGFWIETIELFPGTRVAHGSSVLSIYATAKSRITLNSDQTDGVITPLPEPNFVDQPAISYTEDDLEFRYRAETWTLAYLRSEWMQHLDGTLEIKPQDGAWKVTNTMNVPLTQLRLQPKGGANTQAIAIDGAELLMPGESVLIEPKRLKHHSSNTGVNQPEPRDVMEFETDTDVGLFGDDFTPYNHHFDYLYANLERPYEEITIKGVNPDFTTTTLLRVRLSPTF